MEVKHLKIAVCGQTTPGKRLTCNGLLGKEIIQEGSYEVPDRNMISRFVMFMDLMIL